MHSRVSVCLLTLTLSAACGSDEIREPSRYSSGVAPDPTTPDPGEETETGEADGGESPAPPDLPEPESEPPPRAPVPEKPHKSRCEVDCAAAGEPCQVIDDCAPGLLCVGGGCLAPV